MRRSEPGRGKGSWGPPSSEALTAGGLEAPEERVRPSGQMKVHVAHGAREPLNPAQLSEQRP